MPADILAAITAAGAVYDRNDFADPHLDGPTALTVTADGRVYGHLAAWGTPHIGMGGRVTPPKSRSGYKYFHQGVIATKDGDLPVGKLTLGTGHAPVDGNTDAVAAAAHYDNTGTVAAAVRAGEDAHGIWIAGRIVPGTAPERVDELRMSGVSGDWRGINGSMELVAALAVNVPGFPLPRTEQLVAAGAPTALVAAGVVVHATDTTPEVTGEDLQAMVAAAAEKLVDERMADLARRERVRAEIAPIVASAALDRRARVTAEVERVKAARACDNLGALTAAADSGIPGHLPKDLRQYWTHGAGAARWATSPHPYTALTRALRTELPAKAQHMVNGLAANLFKDRFGIYPGQRKSVTAAGGRRVRTQEGANRFGVNVGDLIPDAIDQVTELGGDFAEAAGNDVANLIDPGRKKTPSDSGAEPETDQVKTPDEASDVDAKSSPSNVPSEKPKEPVAAPKSGPGALIPEQASPETDNVGKSATSVERSADGELLPDSAAPAARTDGTGRLEEDQAPTLGLDGGKLTDFTDGIATYDDGSWADGTSWHTADEPKPGSDDVAIVPDDAAGIDEAADFSADDGLDPAVDDFGEDVTAPTPGDPVTDTDIPVRTDGTGYLEEDQLPETGAHGGALVDYVEGVAFYDDGTDTDGTTWRYSEPYEDPDDPEAIAASANRHARIMRTLGYRAANRRAVYPKA